MEFFVNELSLQGQFHSEEAFREAVRIFIGVFDLINEKVKEKTLYKDNLYLERSAIINENFQASFNRIRNRDIKDAFRRIIFNRLNPKDWRPERVHSVELVYRCPSLDDLLVTDTSVAETAERKLADPGTEKILINFLGSSFANLSSSTVRVIKEERQDVTIDVPFIEKKEGLREFIVFEQEPPDVFLRNVDRFRKKPMRVQGRSVYEEIGTGYLWYLDNLHKNHFEIFSVDKTHIGEAGLDGNVLPGTKDPKKRL